MDSLECLHAQKRRDALLLRSVPQWGRHVISPVCFSAPFSGTHWLNLAQPCTGGLAGFCIKTVPPPVDGCQASDIPSPFTSSQMKGSSGAESPTVISNICWKPPASGSLWACVSEEHEEKQLTCWCIQPPAAPRHTPTAPLLVLTLSFHMGGNDTLYSATAELTNAKYNLAAP